ncbi:F-box/LRR-repeat protein 15 isoform X3 [Cherax quadricarinatus]|uniref:F-box/LRR-repeat protein 15 isoform X3 n=1 Tax=Cherax quadricarinatus TaxID=27406 RepID=UPI00387ED315
MVVQQQLTVVQQQLTMKMSHRESLQLLDLPWDDVVFQHIFPYLNVEDLCCLREVSKGFQKLFIDYMSTCKKLDLSDCTMTNQYFQKITENCTNLQWLSVAKCSWLSDEPLIALFNRNLHLHHVDLSACSGLTSAALQILVIKCKLKALLLANCQWLSLDCWKAIIQHQSDLQHISTANSSDVDIQTLEQFFCKFSRLKVVELDKMELLTDVGLHHLATNCTHIETLSVAGCWKLTDSGLKKVVNHCLKLKLLNIQNCPRVTEKYLCSLCVRGIHVISSCSVAYMVKRRKQVNYLGINIQI